MSCFPSTSLIGNTRSSDYSNYEIYSELIINFMSTHQVIYVYSMDFFLLILKNIIDSYDNTNRYFFQFLCMDRPKLRNIKTCKKKKAHIFKFIWKVFFAQIFLEWYNVTETSLLILILETNLGKCPSVIQCWYT